MAEREKRTAWTARKLLAELRKHSSSRDREGMGRYGIKGGRVLGVRIPVLRKLAREIGRDHALAAELWKTGLRSRTSRS